MGGNQIFASFFVVQMVWLHQRHTNQLKPCSCCIVNKPQNNCCLVRCTCRKGLNVGGCTQINSTWRHQMDSLCGASQIREVYKKKKHFSSTVITDGADKIYCVHDLKPPCTISQAVSFFVLPSDALSKMNNIFFSQSNWFIHVWKHWLCNFAHCNLF